MTGHVTPHRKDARPQAIACGEHAPGGADPAGNKDTSGDASGVDAVAAHILAIHLFFQVFSG